MIGMLTPEMTQALTPFVQGRHIFDLGAYDLRLSKTLVDIGASKVTAVDRSEMPSPSRLYPEIETVQAYFKDVAPVEAAFVSWPVNWPCALLEVIQNADLVIYLGRNTDGMVCGYEALWRHLRGRDVLCHIPCPVNTLVVYGKPLKVPREKGLPEEMAAVYLDRVWTYSEAHSTWGTSCP
jgi:hypothetical protein